jgi:hypothetical protein
MRLERHCEEEGQDQSDELGRLKTTMDTGRKLSTKLSVKVVVGLVVIGLVGIPAFSLILDDETIVGRGSANADGVRLAWKHIGRRVAYLAYGIKSSSSGVFELYWTRNGVRQEDTRRGPDDTAHIFNWEPNGPVEDTANVVITRMPWDNNQMGVLATIEWTDERTLSLPLYSNPNIVAITPEPVKSRIINFKKELKLENEFVELPAEKPFKLLTLTLTIGVQEEPETWELLGNWLSKDNLIEEYKARKTRRSLVWLLANAVRNGMKRGDVVEVIGTGNNADEKGDKAIRKLCRKQGLSLEKSDVFVIYRTRSSGSSLQFRQGVLINHIPEDATVLLFSMYILPLK